MNEMSRLKMIEAAFYLCFERQVRVVYQPHWRRNPLLVHEFLRVSFCKWIDYLSVNILIVILMKHSRMKDLYL